MAYDGTLINASIEPGNIRGNFVKLEHKHGGHLSQQAALRFKICLTKLQATLLNKRQGACKLETHYLCSRGRPMGQYDCGNTWFSTHHAVPFDNGTQRYADAALSN